MSKCDEYFTLMAIIAFSLLAMPYQWADVPFLLANGRYIDVTGIIPTEDQLTIHDGMHAIVQQWLTAWIFWKIYAIWGLDGLYGLSYVLGAVLLYVYYRLLLSASRNNRQLSLLMLLPIGFLFGSLFLMPRPQNFSLLLLFLAVLALEKYVKSASAVYLLWLVPISILTINFHAAFWPLLIVVILPYLAVTVCPRCIRQYFADISFANSKNLLLTLAAVVIVAIINPYGTEAMTYGIISYGNEELAMLSHEMQPMTGRSLLGRLVFFIGAVLIFLSARRRQDLAYTLFSLGFMYMALDSQRNFVFFLTLGLLSLAYMFRDTLKFSTIDNNSISRVNSRVNSKVTLPQKLLLSVMGLSIICAVIFCWSYWTAKILALSFSRTILLSVIVIYLIYVPTRVNVSGFRQRVCMYCLTMFLGLSMLIIADNKFDWTEERADKLIFDYIQANDSRDNITVFANVGIGTYAELYGYKPFIDNRIEVFTPANNHSHDYLGEYIELSTGKIHYRDFFSKYNFDYYITTSEDLADTYLMKDKDYEILLEYDISNAYKKGRYHLFKRKGR